jgi:ubiquinone/menaquinone biosynthesis C-methylase UbiE
LRDLSIRDFYDNTFYGGSARLSSIEQLKQSMRLDTIERLVPIGCKTLVVGCGTGKEIYLPKGFSVGIDLSLSALLVAKKESRSSKPLILADACNLPFKDDTFDCVICSEILEHIPKPERAVAELSRVLNRGIAIITVPNWYSSWGLIRKLAEIFTRKQITAAGQPVDDWFTPRRLYKLLSSSFEIKCVRGIWYLPPHGKGEKTIPDVLILPVYKLLAGMLDRWFGEAFPFAGHIIAVRVKIAD